MRGRVLNAEKAKKQSASNKRKFQEVHSAEEQQDSETEAGDATSSGASTAVSSAGSATPAGSPAPAPAASPVAAPPGCSNEQLQLFQSLLAMFGANPLAAAGAGTPTTYPPGGEKGADKAAKAAEKAAERAASKTAREAEKNRVQAEKAASKAAKEAEKEQRKMQAAAKKQNTQTLTLAVKGQIALQPMAASLGAVDLSDAPPKIADPLKALKKQVGDMLKQCNTAISKHSKNKGVTLDALPFDSSAVSAVCTEAQAAIKKLEAFQAL